MKKSGFKKISKKEIISFFEKHIEKVKFIKEFEEGHVNQVFKINDYSVRINIRDLSIKKLKNEYNLLKYLSKFKLSFELPHPILFKEFKKREVLINFFLDGKSLKSKNLSCSLVKDIARKLRALHHFKGPYFGTFDNHYTTWKGYVNFMLKRNTKENIRFNSLDKKRINKIIKIIKEKKQYLNSIKKPFFVHGDPGFSNFLVKENRVSGMIDFEWSFFGDPIFDFAILELAVNEYSKIRKLFEKEYKLNHLKNLEIRKDLYKILYLSEIITIDKRFWKSKFRKEMINQLDEILKRYTY